MRSCKDFQGGIVRRMDEASVLDTSRLRKNSIYIQNAVGIFHMTPLSQQIQEAQKARLLTRPTLARRDAPCLKQGRSERRGEEVPTALRVGRSPVEWILANGKSLQRIRYPRDLPEPLSIREGAGGLFQHPATMMSQKPARFRSLRLYKSRAHPLCHPLGVVREGANCS